MPTWAQPSLTWTATGTRTGWPDFAIIDYDGIRWYRNPGPPYAGWPETVVSVSDSIPEHGGLAVGDFDGDGDSDIFRINRWYENRDGGRTWIRRPGPEFGIFHPAFYGLSARTVVRDIDKDGDLDLVQAECDIPNGRVAWFENSERGGLWVPHLIKDSTDHQDFHSLDLADFDGDGDLDFLASGSLSSPGARHWYVWENLDGKGGALQEHVIWRDAMYGGHEAVAFDMDGDGDADILGKEFSWYHVWLENRRLPGTGIMGGPKGVSANRSTRPWLGSGWLFMEYGGGGKGPADALGRRRAHYPGKGR